MDQEKDSKTKLPTRTTRISRAAAKITTTIRTKPEEKQSPPPEKPPTPKKESPKEEIETIQPSTSRNSPPRGRGKSRGRASNRRNRRTNAPLAKRNRLERAQNASNRNQRRRNFTKITLIIEDLLKDLD